MNKEGHGIEFDMFNHEYLSCRYYECNFQKIKNVKCRARLKINGNCILTGHHENHYKPTFKLADIKKEIKGSQPCETTRSIKKRIISK